MTLLILSRKDMLALTSGMRKYGNVDGAKTVIVCFNVLFCQVKTLKDLSLSADKRYFIRVFTSIRVFSGLNICHFSGSRPMSEEKM